MAIDPESLLPVKSEIETSSKQIKKKENIIIICGFVVFIMTIFCIGAMRMEMDKFGVIGRRQLLTETPTTSAQSESSNDNQELRDILQKYDVTGIDNAVQIIYSNSLIVAQNYPPITEFRAKLLKGRKYLFFYKSDGGFLGRIDIPNPTITNCILENNNKLVVLTQEWSDKYGRYEKKEKYEIEGDLETVQKIKTDIEDLAQLDVKRFGKQSTL